MNILTASEARVRLYKLIDEAFLTHEPYIIKGKRHNAVLLSEQDWKSLQETLYLVSIPGMKESIQEGIKTPLTETTTNLIW